jgi:hypothetical protein
MAASTLLGAGPHGAGCPAQAPVVLTLVGFSAPCSLRFATVDPGLQLLSTRPGWPIASPAVPVSDLSSTWLLLNIKNVLPRCIKLPRVPEQQVVEVLVVTLSVELPPLVPSLMGTACPPALLF